ncbi:uncharacterized protein [Ptychodera flava]|uniref:uncharacterized protein n=1 Tax=Ptychodera flava TaxID=63121 RepID=UPI00396A4035
MEVVMKILVFAFLLTFLVGDGNGDGGDVCYSCSWPEAENCDPVDDTTSTCPGSKCTKISTYYRDELTAVGRLCVTACTESDNSNGGIRIEVKCCEGDRCNNAVYSVVSFVALFLSFTTAIYHTAL